MDAHGSHYHQPELAHVTLRAASRWKLERVKLALSRTLMSLTVLLGAWSLFLIFKHSWIAPFPFVLAGAALTLAGIALHGWLRRPDPKAIHRAIDRRLSLPDLTLSAGELTGNDSWLAHLRQQTLASTGAVDWSRVWPVPWPKWTGHSTFGCVALVASLGYLYNTDLQFNKSLQAQPLHRDPRTVAIEALFNDWEQAKATDKELEKLLEKISPIKESLTSPQATEKQRLVDMCQLEEIVAAEKAKLDAQSLEPQAAQLAEALEPMEGMSALAAALRKKDFEKAADQARQAEEKLAQENAQLPKGSKEAADAAQKLAQQLARSGQQQKLSQSLAKLSEGAKQGDCKKMSASMKEMKECMLKQSSSNEERKRLAAQLSQLAFCKNPGDGECKNPGMSLMPMLSLMKQKKPGSGAGSETDLNRFGDPTKLASERRSEAMKNTLTEGESETTIVKSAEGQTEATRSGHKVSFQEYQQLSQQAIADEAIPSAHREAIKRYFEKIRPQTGK